MKIKMSHRKYWRIFDKAVKIYFFVTFLLLPLLITSCVTLVRGDYLEWYNHLSLAIYTPYGIWIALLIYFIIPEEGQGPPFSRVLSLALAVTISVFGLSNLTLAIIEFVS